MSAIGDVVIGIEEEIVAGQMTFAEIAQLYAVPVEFVSEVWEQMNCREDW